MGEVSYVWANPDSPNDQVALSALVRAMDSCLEDASKIKDTGTPFIPYLPIPLPSFPSPPFSSALTEVLTCDVDIGKKTGEKRKPKKLKYCAVARLVTADNRDPRMGVLWPMRFPDVDCLLWVPVCHYS